MSIVLVLIVGLLCIFLSIRIFKKLFNPLSLYTVIWTTMIFLYELKLMSFIPLSFNAWLVIIGGSGAFLLGVLLVYFGREVYNKNSTPLFNTPEDYQNPLFLDGGKVVRIVLIATSTIGLLASIQHWMVLIEKFGSIPLVLASANIIYSMRVAGEIEGIVPYLSIFGNIGLFFAAIYAAHKNKFSLITLLPIFAIVLHGIASFGRAGLLFGFLQFLIVFVFYRYLIVKKDPNKVIKVNKNFIVVGIILFALMIASATVVRTVRGSVEEFKQSSARLGQLEDNLILTPSIYLYLSSHVGVLSKYLEKADDASLWGENTFLPIINFFARFELIDHPGFYQKGYYIPMWTNTGTYLREVHSDFGNIGVVLVPFLLGLLVTYFWFSFFEKKKMISLVALSFLSIVIGISFLMMITRAAMWFLSFALLIVMILVMENYLKNRYSKKEG